MEGSASSLAESAPTCTGQQSALNTHDNVKPSTETLRFIKYVGVGVSNTLITFLTFTLLRTLHCDEYLANALGYLAGMVNSFCWNRQWVFRSMDGNRLHQAIWFLIGALLCWLVQLGVFSVLLRMALHESAAYLIGMGCYTVLNYLFNKKITFRSKN